MKPILMSVREDSPYCKEAILWMEELKKENHKYLKLDINFVKDSMYSGVGEDAYEMSFVPTLYVGGTKVHQGTVTKDTIREVFDKALEE